jgi:hypothetical protein
MNTDNTLSIVRVQAAFATKFIVGLSAFIHHYPCSSVFLRFTTRITP